jgi:hypothetical protein
VDEEEEIEQRSPLLESEGSLTANMGNNTPRSCEERRQAEAAQVSQVSPHVAVVAGACMRARRGHWAWSFIEQQSSRLACARARRLAAAEL